MKGARGFVLVNALVLVTALSAAALFLLSRAEAARVRASAAIEASQISANLDAFEALAITLLNADARAGAPGDHLGEAWAQPVRDVELARGRISGEIHDMQGLFNLNMLSNSSNVVAREAFDALALTLGLAPTRVDAIVAHLSPGGPERTTSYTGMAVPTDPVGGALFLPQQLRDIPGLNARDIARLRAVATALPQREGINVNTAPAAVLAAFLPTANTAGLNTLVQRVKREPFTSVEAFIQALGSLLDDEALAAVDPDLFTTQSDWFELRATATQEGRSATRIAALRRWPLPQGAEVAYRLDDWTR